MKKKTEDLLKKLFDYQKFEDDPKLNQTIKDSNFSDDSFVSEKDLAVVSGGQRNSDGTFSFTKGQRYYVEHMRYHIYEVLEDYTNVPGNAMIKVGYYNNSSGTFLFNTTVSAAKLQECANYNGVVR